MKNLPMVLSVITSCMLGLAAYLWWPVTLVWGWAIGLLLGLLLLWGDELVAYRWYQDETSSPQGERTLITRSTLFLLAIVPLAIFVVTSTGSTIGWGIVMALLFGIGWEMWVLRKQSDVLRQRFFQAAPQISSQTLEWLPWVWLGVSSVLSLIVLIP